MCIDDDADALESLGLRLQIDGAQVLPFRSGSAALPWLQ